MKNVNDSGDYEGPYGRDLVENQPEQAEKGTKIPSSIVGRGFSAAVALVWQPFTAVICHGA